MSHGQPKTEGYTWLEYSFIAFNGSGYANRESPEQFVNSYIDYNRFKRRLQAVKLAEQYYQALVILAEDLINTSQIDRQPSSKQWAKFQAFKSQLKIP